MEGQPKNPVASHYNKVYSEKENVFGGGDPQPLVIEASRLIPEGAEVIEFGAGQGRNALVLAEQGFKVKVIEISEVAVNLMNQMAHNKSLANFEAQVGDARENFEGEYDMVVSTFMLHHLTTEEAKGFIMKIKEHTKGGGLNVVTTFTVEGDFSKLPNASGRFYPNLGEMKQLYSDWEILGYTEDESMARTTKPDGTPMFNIKAEILARKPK